MHFLNILHTTNIYGDVFSEWLYNEAYKNCFKNLKYKKYFKMDLQFCNGMVYFPYPQIEKQITINGGKELSTEKDILEATKDDSGYFVVGYVSPNTSQELVGVKNRSKVYVVTSLSGAYILCLRCGTIIY